MCLDVWFGLMLFNCGSCLFWVLGLVLLFGVDFGDLFGLKFVGLLFVVLGLNFGLWCYKLGS